MNPDLKLAEGFLQTLKDETDHLDHLMDQMLTEMENTPPEERSGEGWDAFTKRFLEVQAAQQKVAEKLQRANIAFRNSGGRSTKQ